MASKTARLMVLFVSAALSLFRAADARQMDASDVEEIQDAAMDSYSDALTKGDVEGFVKVLGVKADQKGAIMDLFSAYRAQYDSATKKFRDYQKSLRDRSGGGYDPKVWEEAGPVTEDYTKHVRKLKQTFMDDLKTMIPGDAADNWAKVERRVRRKEATRTAMLGASRADLVAIAESVMGNEPVPDDARSVLEKYEEEIDRSMNEMNEFRKDLENRYAQITKDAAGKSAEEMQKMQLDIMKKMNEKSMGAAELNNRTFKRLVPLMPEARRARFQVSYYKTAYGMMEQWMPGAASLSKAVDKALKLESLTAEQKSIIEGVMDDHSREVVGSYEKYAGVMEGKAQEAMKSDDPAVIQGMFYDQTAWMDLSKAKGEADRKAAERIRAALTEAQLADLPSPLKKSDTTKPTFEE